MSVTARSSARRRARLSVVARPHWMNALLLWPAAKPYLRLDGVEHALAWGRTSVFILEPGPHVLEGFWRYRSTRAPLGTGTLQVQVEQGEQVFVDARNGPLNHQPLELRRRPTP